MSLDQIVRFKEPEEIDRDQVLSKFEKIRPDYFGKINVDAEEVLAFIEDLGDDRLVTLFYLVADYYQRAETKRLQNPYDEKTGQGYSQLDFHDFTHITRSLLTLKRLVTDKGGVLLADRAEVQYSAAALLIHDIAVLSIQDLREPAAKDASDAVDDKLNHELPSYEIGLEALKKAGYSDKSMVNGYSEIDRIRDNILATQWRWAEGFKPDALQPYSSVCPTLGMYFTRISDLFCTLGAAHYETTSTATLCVVAENENLQNPNVDRIYEPAMVERTSFFMRAAIETIGGAGGLDLDELPPYLDFEGLNTQDNSLTVAGIWYFHRVCSNSKEYLLHAQARGVVIDKVVYDGETPTNINTHALYQILMHNGHELSRA